jgi:molybdopterin synthase catalytic subunit
MMIEIILQSDPINVDELMSDCSTDSDGAIVTFTGRARDNSKGKKVTHLEYEIYESMAQRELEIIAEDALNKWQFSNCIVVHRYGRICIGEASIFIAVSSPHRDEAFQAVRYIIDTVKMRVPIWKKEFYQDGSSLITGGS